MLHNGYIAFAIIEVRGDSAEEISARMGAVTGIASENYVTTDTLISGFVFISRGTTPFAVDDKPPEPFFVLLLKIQSELNENARISYCSESSAFGIIGHAPRYTYSFIAPSFTKALSQLLATPFGKIAEVT